MHLRCALITIKNLVHFLLIISLAFQTSYSQQKESIPEFENFPIIDSELERSEEDLRQGSDDWVQQTSSSSISFSNVGYDKVLPKFTSTDEVVDHVIKEGIIENLETQELETISNKYNENNYNNNNNDRNTDLQPKDYKHFSSLSHRNRWPELLKNLLQLYKLKQLDSSGILAKRGEGPQLSIVNPLDVLRQRLLLELARRRMKENQDQIQANAEILKKIGRRKRSIRSSETIPQQTVLSAQELTITENTSKSRYLSDRETNYRYLNTNSEKSLNKCQKCRRKKM